MNRNQRIVVSIVGIIIVTLALIGITYAYFLTKIIGNSTSTSISGTLANLELTYGDGNGIIAPKDPIMPGTTLTSKIFTVQNTGTARVDNYIVVLENVTNTLSRNGDLVYTLTCTSDHNYSCNGIEEETFPASDMIIVSDSIEPTVIHTYTLTVTYKNLEDTNQSDDMGATFSAKVNIYDKSTFNPYKNEKDSLAYKILQDNGNKITSSEFNVNYIKNDISNIPDNGFGIIKDNYGKSYYFKGNVDNNYLNFAGMCWRIVRIQGDGSIKIVLEDEKNLCNSSSKSYKILSPSTLNNAPGELETWFNSNIKTLETNLKQEFWPYHKEFPIYDGGHRYKSLISQNNNSTLSYIGLLSADEVLFAGVASPESGLVVYDGYARYSFLTIPSVSWLTISGDYGGSGGRNTIYVHNFGRKDNFGDILFNYSGVIELPLRPSIVLKKGITVSGDGTKSNPYVVS